MRHMQGAMKTGLLTLGLALALAACATTPQQRADLAKFNAARDAQLSTANTDR